MSTPARDPQRESQPNDSLLRAFLRCACPHGAFPLPSAPLTVSRVEHALTSLRTGRESDDSLAALRDALYAEESVSRTAATQGLLSLYSSRRAPHSPACIPQALVDISIEAIANSALYRATAGINVPGQAADQRLLDWGTRLLADGIIANWRTAWQVLGEHRVPEVRIAFVDLLDRIVGSEPAAVAVWEAADALLADSAPAVRLSIAATMLRHSDVLMLGLQVPHSDVQRFLHTITDDLVAYGEQLPQFSAPVFEALFQDFPRAFTDYVVKFPENSGAPELCQAALDTFWTLKTLASAGAWQKLIECGQLALPTIERVYAIACEGARIFGARSEAESANGVAVLDRPAPGAADYTFALGRAVTPAIRAQITQLSRAFQIVTRVEGWTTARPAPGSTGEQVLTGHLGRHLVRASIPNSGAPTVDLYLADSPPEHVTISPSGALPLADLIQRRYRQQLHSEA